ncbi:MAG TPA: hypothetical protein P5572_10050 [Phycisphaerae bacterium]|nr:hypothetical protein [Phycisphaerae bacterium]
MLTEPPILDDEQGAALADFESSGPAGFNLTMEEVRILAKYRALSRHQQKGILQAIELIRPAALRNGTRHQPR